MLKEAEQILGYDILKLCTEGPKEKLDDTTYAQVPTVFNSINTSNFHLPQHLQFLTLSKSIH